MTYEFKTWETINLPAVSGDTYFQIYDHQTSEPGGDPDGIIYSGLVLGGYGIQSLNEILCQYVSPDQIAFDTSVYLDNSSHSTFYIYYTQDDWTSWTYDIVILTYDWSYETASSAVLSDPVANLVDARQFFLYSIRAGSPDVQTTITMRIDGETVRTFPISGYTYYSLVQDLASTGAGNGSKITVGPSVYYVTSTCCNYCLYYLNQYGGWDSLLFRGRQLQTDDLSRLSYKKNYVAQSDEFHKVDYLTTLQERWSLNTSFLNDAESSKMINLTASNRIYIHDLETGKISPVNITNSNCERKTYRNQGRKMAVYTVEVAASQPKYRV